MKFMDRLQLWIHKQDLSIRSFEKSIGASDGLIRRALSQGTDIQGKWLVIIAKTYPELSMDWLILGQGPMLIHSLDANSKNSSENTETNTDSNLNELLLAKRQVLLLVTKLIEE